MSDILSTAKAGAISKAILEDGTFCGTPEWLRSHGLTNDEFVTFLEYAKRLAAMYEHRDAHLDEVGAISFEGTVAKKLNTTKTKTTFAIDVDTNSVDLNVLSLFLEQDVHAQVFNKNLPLPFEELQDDGEFHMNYPDADGVIG